MSANRINIGREAYSLDYDDSKGAYTKVRIIFDERADPVEVGTDDGRVLEIKNPWAESIAEQMAQDILTRIQGYEYQPFDARGAFLPDNTELGDAVVVDGVYGAIVSQDITFDGLGNSDASAPNGEDNENEFGDYVPSADNSVDGKLERLRTSFIVEYGHIRSEISSVESELSSAIDQRLDEITLSVSSANGSTTFTLKDGEATLDTKTLNLTVDHANISGLLTASQIDVSTLHVGSGGISVDNGAISWAKLDDSTKTTINGAVDDASDALDAATSAENTVNNWVYPNTTYIDGSQIMTGTVRAQNLYGGTCYLYYSTYSQGRYTDYIRGGFTLSSTSTGIGVDLFSNSGLRLTAGTNSNVYISAGAGASVSVENGIGLSGDYVAFTRNCYGTASPLNNSAVPAVNGGVYFQIVS